MGSAVLCGLPGSRGYNTKPFSNWARTSTWSEFVAGGFGGGFGGSGEVDCFDDARTFKRDDLLVASDMVLAIFPAGYRGRRRPEAIYRVAFPLITYANLLRARARDVTEV